MAAAALLAPAGRVAMISDADPGIGLAVARRLRDDGYSLSLGARDEMGAVNAKAPCRLPARALPRLRRAGQPVIEPEV